ncbi:g1978 [Coccomyxa elongata]
MQRLQVRALAAIYGLEARACGRTGQTLFKTDRAGPLTTEGCAQVQRLLACSIPSGKPTPELKRELEQAMRSSRTALSRPITANNKGSLMLKQMGWSEGSGLGAARQGRTEPVPLHLGQRRQGLGR